uniref:Ubiquitin conjugating enzyme E2 E2 n=1 Tax=Ailuropoda melanoleuca TaxID=9646 RepID=A0A7N5K238_AILME
MSTEAQRVDDSPSTSGGSSDGDQRESVQQEPEREQVQPKKKEGKISSKTAAKLSTSAKRIQKELAEITLDPPPNCRECRCLYDFYSRRFKRNNCVIWDNSKAIINVRNVS